MTSGGLSREFEVFLAALDRASEDRGAFLDERCAGDDPLRARVQALLENHHKAEIAETSEAAPAVTRPEMPGTIGPYAVRSRLGEGGMGVVYAAEQRHPIRRRVAVKLLKGGADSREVLARFDAERQALALMNHANIAQILDAGVHEGRPYFVMELIAGVPITEYCDRRSLPIEERLGLFVAVCEGVQHAHRKGIIHRDLKPTNILVSEEGSRPTPKIIDFGIAKAVTEHLLEATVHTEVGRIIGTPDYMSPEQADVTALDIDTRSDVYSLGALLYELLCGSTVFGLSERSAGLDEIRSTILDKTPTRVSDRFLAGERPGDVASRRGASRDALARVLRQDLDWITQKALEKDRVRRYGSAAELAGDIRRFLAGGAVVARPPSTGYRVRKFVRRNRGTVVAGAVLACAIATATVTSTLAAVSAQGQRDEAERRAADLERVAAFEAERLAAIEPRAFGETIRGLIIDAASEEDADRLAELLEGVNFTTVALRGIDRHVFDETIRQIDERFADDAGTRATLLQSASTTMTRLGLSEDALDPQTTALELRAAHLGPEHALTAESVAQMGGLLKILGRFTESEEHYRDAVRILERERGPLAPGVLKLRSELGLLLGEMARYGDALDELRAALSGYRAVHGEAHADTVKALNDIGLVLHEQGELAESAVYLKAALDASRRLLGPHDEQLLAAVTNYGGSLIRQGRLAEGTPYLEEALEGFRATLGDDHHTTMTMVSNMGYLKQELGDFEEAERFYLESLETRRRVLGEDHADTLVSELNLANLYIERGDPAAGERLLLHTVGVRRRDLGEAHPRTINAANNLAVVYRLLGRPGDALRITEAQVQRTLPELPDRHSMIGSVWSEHARSLLDLERFADASAAAQNAYEARTATFGPSHSSVLAAAELVIEVHERWHVAEPDAGHDRTADEWKTKHGPD